ncbi:MAG: deoxyhypusine synthase family protein [Planctomycetota bacterium]|jgi:deoxyhypusine synthase
MDDPRKELLSEVTTKPRLDDDPRELLARAGSSGFQLGSLGRSVEVWKAMLQDEDCTVYLGVAGAVVPAGLGPLLGQVVRQNMVDVVYSTGAQVYHDLYEAFRGHHYKLRHPVSDTRLARLNIDRIYDVVADDVEYQRFDELIAERIEGFPPSAGYTTAGFLKTLVESLQDHLRDGAGMVLAAVEKEVPVFIPTLHDSSASFAMVLLRHRDGRTPVNVDYTEDLYQQYRIFKEAKTTGAIFIGGGVPKNHIQQLHPLLQVVEGVYGHQEGTGHGYGAQFTADQPVWGGLSGCTMEESESWGKYNAESMRAVCYGDATINFTLAAMTVYQELKDFLGEREPRRLMRRLEAEAE